MVTSAIDRPYLYATFGAPHRQNRWAVGFRAVLVIPHALVLLVLTLVLDVVVTIGWFAALFAGRLPAWVAKLVANYIKYAARVGAYSYLLTDSFPPFNGTDPYPVNVEVPLSRVRRLAVLFRLFLLIPAGIIAGVASVGQGVAAFFIWLIVLVRGRMPESLFGAISAVLRFQARYQAYAFMMTGKYPGELYGDMAMPFDMTPGAVGGTPSSGPLPPPIPPYPGTVARPTPAEPPPFGYTGPGSSYPPAAPAYPAPGPGHPPPSPGYPPPSPGYPPPSPGYGAPNYPAPLVSPSASSAPPPPMPPPVMPSVPEWATPSVGRLVLSSGAKGVVTLFIVLGVLGYIADTGVQVALALRHTARTQLVDAHDTLAQAITTATEDETSCTSGPGACLNAYRASVATAFGDFASSMSTIAFPAFAQSDAMRLESDSTSLATLLHAMSAQGSAPSNGAQAESLGQTFDTDFQHLAAELP